MKKTAFCCALFTLFFATLSRAISPVQEFWGGYWKGADYGVAATSPEHLAAVAWEPESADVPLRVNDAIKAARGSLRKMVGDGHVHFECDEVRLRDIGGTGKWVYVVQFQSGHPSQTTKLEAGDALAILPFIVYLNGFVESPQKSKKGLRVRSKIG